MSDTNLDGEVKFILGQISGQLTAFITRVDIKHAEIDRDFAAVHAQFERQDKRISALEQWKWAIMGGAAVLGSIAQVVIHMVMK